MIYYLKALAGLRKLTDRSPEKRLEPLQEHLTFPALIYLRFCQSLCLSCKLIWIANNQEANAGGELHHLCAGLCLLSLLKNTIDRFLCGERPAKVYSPSFQSIYLSALLVLSSCLFLVGSKDVVASEGLILAVIKTASSIIRVKAPSEFESSQRCSLQAATSAVLDSIFSTLQPAVSHLVFLSLQWAETHPAPDLRTASLRLLLQLPNLPPSPSHLSLLASLLPGVLSRLVRVTQDASLLQVRTEIPTQGHQITPLPDFCKSTVCGSLGGVRWPGPER